MKYEIYTEFKVAYNYEVFEFTSVGKKGAIVKRIEFTPTEMPHIVNLAFGDIGADNEIDDHIISDNGDRNKILATIAYVKYLQIYPDRFVYFKGSKEERTRLYRMAVGLNFDELSKRFAIFAEREDEFIPFEKNIEVIGLLIRKKIH